MKFLNTQISPIGNTGGRIGDTASEKAILNAAARVLNTTSEALVDKNGLITEKGAKVILKSDANQHPAVQKFIEMSLDEIGKSGAHALILSDILKNQLEDILN